THLSPLWFDRSQVPLVARRRDMRLVQRHGDACQPTSVLAECPGVYAVGQVVGDDSGKRLRRGVHTRKCRIVIEVSVGKQTKDRFQLAGGTPDVHHDAVRIELGSAEGGIDDVRRPVQLLGGSKDLAAQAMGDHHVVADGHAEQDIHSLASAYVMTWASPERVPSASPASTSGSSSNEDSPLSRASNAESWSSSSASASRSRKARRPRRAAATAPTWLPRIASRREWNAPPRWTVTGRSPYQ